MRHIRNGIKNKKANEERKNVKNRTSPNLYRCLDAYAIEKEIIKLEEDSERLMELMNTTSGDVDRILNEIKTNFDTSEPLMEYPTYSSERINEVRPNTLKIE